MLEQLIPTAKELALGFRLSKTVETGLALNKFLPQLVAYAPQLTLEQQQLLVTLAKEMLAFQTEHNWLALADHLEYELVALLEGKLT